jgi:hypothetical protein
MCDVLLPPGVNPIVVKYIYIYNIINGYNWKQVLKNNNEENLSG